jgi:hypothetical protein
MGGVHILVSHEENNNATKEQATNLLDGGGWLYYRATFLKNRGLY